MKPEEFVVEKSLWLGDLNLNWLGDIGESLATAPFDSCHSRCYESTKFIT